MILFIFFTIFLSCLGQKCADHAASACGNGGNALNYGYACPSMMMLSDEMIKAAKKDGLERYFIYGVAGGASDADCGKCFMIQLLDAEREWRSDFKYLILQVVNSGSDVLANQFDIFMGAGGFGYFTSCNQDCKNSHCQGGPCKEGMFAGYFHDWVNAQYFDPNLCYSGGIKWLDQKNNSELFQLCRNLIGDEDAHLLKNKDTINSCYRTNAGLYHQNFVSARSVQVQCPIHLCRTTGLKRNDDADHPQANPQLRLTNECQGDRNQGRYCITTMQDCCKMSCSWSGKIANYAFNSSFPCVYTCDKRGVII